MIAILISNMPDICYCAKFQKKAPIKRLNAIRQSTCMFDIGVNVSSNALNTQNIIQPINTTMKISDISLRYLAGLKGGCNHTCPTTTFTTYMTIPFHSLPISCSTGLINLPSPEIATYNSQAKGMAKIDMITIILVTNHYLFVIPLIYLFPHSYVWGLY